MIEEWHLCVPHLSSYNTANPLPNLAPMTSSPVAPNIPRTQLSLVHLWILRAQNKPDIWSMLNKWIILRTFDACIFYLTVISDRENLTTRNCTVTYKRHTSAVHGILQGAPTASKWTILGRPGPGHYPRWSTPELAAIEKVLSKLGEARKPAWGVRFELVGFEWVRKKV